MWGNRVIAGAVVHAMIQTGQGERRKVLKSRDASREREGWVRAI